MGPVAFANVGVDGARVKVTHLRDVYGRFRSLDVPWIDLPAGGSFSLTRTDAGSAGAAVEASGVAFILDAPGGAAGWVREAAAQGGTLVEISAETLVAHRARVVANRKAAGLMLVEAALAGGLGELALRHVESEGWAVALYLAAGLYARQKVDDAIALALPTLTPYERAAAAGGLGAALSDLFAGRISLGGVVGGALVDGVSEALRERFPGLPCAAELAGLAWDVFQGLGRR